MAVLRDPVDVELGASDHEVDVHLALVHAGLVRGILDRMVVAVTERDVRRRVLVDECVVEDAPERADAPAAVHERDLAEP